MTQEGLRTPEQQTTKTFIDLLTERQISANTLLCVGLDTDYSRLPEYLRSHKGKDPEANAIYEFNTGIIDKTHDLVCAYKPNSAFYEEHGSGGWNTLAATIANVKRLTHNQVPVILDAKRTDIGTTNLPYTRMAFDYCEADAITVNPYFGGEALQPFLDRADKGVIVLCRTSNPGAREFQDLLVDHPELGKVPLYQVVAHRAAHEWNKNGNVCLVVGATYPAELGQVRRIVGDMPILVPGLGAQGGRPQDIAQAFDSHGRGIIANNGRDIIFAQNPREEAIKWRDAINQYR